MMHLSHGQLVALVLCGPALLGLLVLLVLIARENRRNRATLRALAAKHGKGRQT